MRHILMLVAFTTAALCLWLTSAPAVAQVKQSEDGNFVREAAMIDTAEIKLGELAQDHGGSDAVRKFGARMVKDHTRSSQLLHEVAKKQGITLPEKKLDAKHQQLFEQLSKLRGAEFDRMYTKDMVMGHQKALEKFETEAKSGQNPQIRTFAKEMLPTLQEHLQLAKQCAQQVK